MSTTPELRRAARGLREAFDRWQPTRLDQEPDAMLIETTVVAWWLRALDELLPESSSSYLAEKASDREIDDLLAGLRHARNRLGHRIAGAIRVDHGGFSFPLVAPLVSFELRWVDPAVLDRFGGAMATTVPQLDGEAAYARALAGRLVRHTLPTAVIWMLARPELQEPSEDSCGH
jgi:hypothetical protein